MNVAFRHARHLLVPAIVAWIWATGAALARPSGQEAIPASSLSDLVTRVRAGEVVYVTDATGATLKGRFSAASDDGVGLYVGGALRRVPKADVRLVQRQQPDSPLTGVLIGAGIGAIPAIYWLAADPNECTGMCRRITCPLPSARWSAASSTAPSTRRPRSMSRVPHMIGM